MDMNLDPGQGSRSRSGTPAGVQFGGAHYPVAARLRRLPPANLQHASGVTESRLDQARRRPFGQTTTRSYGKINAERVNNTQRTDNAQSADNAQRQTTREAQITREAQTTRKAQTTRRSRSLRSCTGTRSS